jgi:hypothetical protein
LDDANLLSIKIRIGHPKAKHKAVQLLPSGVDEEPVIGHQRRPLEMSVAIDATHTFRKGQLVKWKPGLKNRAMPAYNEIAVVREILAAPVFDDCEQARCAGTPYFREPLTLVLGLFDTDGEFYRQSTFWPSHMLVARFGTSPLAACRPAPYPSRHTYMKANDHKCSTACR